MKITNVSTITSAATDERRGSHRINVAHAAKVYDPRAERFFSAETCNISATGALLKLQRSMPVNHGDHFEVGILPEPRREELLSLEDMMSARVVRVTAIDRFSQAVALQYESPITVFASVHSPQPVDARRAASHSADRIAA